LGEADRIAWLTAVWDPENSDPRVLYGKIRSYPGTCCFSCIMKKFVDAHDATSASLAVRQQLVNKTECTEADAILVEHKRQLALDA
jgi:hypothetical protein